jgi:hypothetical protein
MRPMNIGIIDIADNNVGEDIVINVVVQSGVVKSPALRYGIDDKPRFRFTLLKEDTLPTGRRAGHP